MLLSFAVILVVVVPDLRATQAATVPSANLPGEDGRFAVLEIACMLFENALHQLDLVRADDVRVAVLHISPQEQISTMSVLSAQLKIMMVNRMAQTIAYPNTCGQYGHAF